jgi:nanoRNase/pAp phosphatase (c-di-AMP/oligoRNAs hydrolase)
LLYTIFPEQNISMWVVDGRNKINVAITIGHSILNRTSKVDVGSLLLYYGGGGHKQVGSCQVSYDEADKIIAEILEKINK